MRKKQILSLIFLLLFSNTSFAYDCRELLGIWDITAEEFDPWVWQFTEASQEVAFGLETDRHLDGSTHKLQAVWDVYKRMYVISDIADPVGDAHYASIVDDTMTGYWDTEFFGKITRHNFTGKRRPLSACPASLLLEEDQENLELLRQFRDEFLVKAESGRRLVKLYYECAPIVCEILKNNPQLRGQYRAILQSFIPIIEIILSKE